MTKLYSRTVAQLAAGLQRGDFSSVELTRVFLKRIEALDPKLNSYVTVTADRALQQAEAADARRKAGNATPLSGIPYAHKDIFCTEGVRTSCGSRMLDSFIAPYDATVTSHFQRAGMVMLGKTNMDEFAMGSSNETSFYGPVHNPWDLERVPGGSSGGSAAAVAARIAPFATGTDTGGSIRQPAALCGITGLKPTYGVVSRFGMIAFASSLDQGGPLTQSAEDAALVLNVIGGYDQRDSTSVERPMENYARLLNEPLNGIRVGLPKEFFGAGLEPGIADAIHAAAKQFEQLGATLKDVSLPNSKLSIPAYYVVAPAECSSNLSRYDGVRFGYRCKDPKDLTDLFCRSRGEGFGAEVKRRIMIGTYVLSAGYYDAYYLKALKVRRLIRNDFDRAFQDVDILIGPTSPSTAFRLGEKTSDPVTMYLSDIYTIAVNLAGLPGMSIAGGFVDNLPVGLQIIGKHFEEARMLNVAHQYQLATDWHMRVPPQFA